MSAALFALLLASCTSDPSLQMTSPGFNMSGPDLQTAKDASDTTAGPDFGSSSDATLPQKVAVVPAKNPAAPKAAAEAKASDLPQDIETAAIPAAAPALNAKAGAGKAQPAAAGEAAAPDGPAKLADDAAAALAEAAGSPAAAPSEPKKRGFLSAFFAAAPASAATAAMGSQRGGSSGRVAAQAKPVVASADPAGPPPSVKAPQVIENLPAPQKPVVQLASADDAAAKPVRASLSGGGLDDLPGVRQTALFEIKRKSGIDDDSDVDLHEDEFGGPVQLASAAGMARLAPNGLLTQTSSVDVACLKPSLVRVLRTIEQHFGTKIMVTSGYRSPEHNRQARGAKNSLHMYCAAADIQLANVSKWELANYVRTMPGRGGVGTYCHTNSVHVDVGPERDWNWRCRRRET